MGVRRRRHLILDGRHVSAIEDDVLDPELLGDESVLQGEGALLAALNSAFRTSAAAVPAVPASALPAKDKPTARPL